MDLSHFQIQLIDDHPIFLQGLAQLLAQGNANVCTATSAEAVLEQLTVAGSRLPDLILIDLFMPDMDGLTFVEAARARKLLVPVAVISATQELQHIRQVLDAGAFGFIPKAYGRDKLLNAVTTMLSGEVYLPAELRQRFSALQASHRSEMKAHGFSERQVQILQLLSKGYSNKKVSSILNISDETVKSHLRNLFRLLEVSTRTEAVTKAIEFRLL